MPRIYETTRWHNVRSYVLRRDQYVCHWCGKPGANEADHLTSLSEGGSAFSPANLVASCRSCNRSRAGHVTNARKTGGFLGNARGLTPQFSIARYKADNTEIGAIRV